MSTTVRELVEGIPEKQRRSVETCLEACDISYDTEIDSSVDTNLISFLKTISNPIRFKILKMTRDKWLCVCLISRALNVDQTLVSHHLRALRNMGLVRERRIGKIRLYRSNVDAVREYIGESTRELGI
ncbi:MAG: helix-turn-helix transcriptional regulator [Thermococci archaeon]|nr:helix-turn-helix transcriptional regulator [Thermococci archaeon]